MPPKHFTMICYCITNYSMTQCFTDYNNYMNVLHFEIMQFLYYTCIETHITVLDVAI